MKFFNVININIFSFPDCLAASQVDMIYSGHLERDICSVEIVSPVRIQIPNYPKTAAQQTKRKTLKKL